MNRLGMLDSYSAESVGRSPGHGRRSHHDFDRAHRARFGAETVADALLTVDQRGLPAQDLEHIALGTGGDAAAAADAPVGIDVGMLGEGSGGRLEAGPPGSLHRGMFPAPVPLKLHQDGEREYRSEDDVDDHTQGTGPPERMKNPCGNLFMLRAQFVPREGIFCTPVS